VGNNFLVKAAHRKILPMSGKFIRPITNRRWSLNRQKENVIKL